MTEALVKKKGRGPELSNPVDFVAAVRAAVGDKAETKEPSFGEALVAARKPDAPGTSEAAPVDPSAPTPAEHKQSAASFRERLAKILDRVPEGE